MTDKRKSDPYLDAGMHGFIRKTAAKEFWRVAAWYDDVADLVQDGYLCYCKCRARYVDQLRVLPTEDPTDEHRRWMMSLVMTAFDRYIRHTLAGKMRYGHEVPVSQLARAGASEAPDPWEGLAPAQAEDASLALLVCSLPAELQQLIVILAGDGAAALDMGFDRLERRRLPSGAVRVVRRSRRRTRETTNQYYCRLLGLDPTEHDLAGQVRTLLRS